METAHNFLRLRCKLAQGKDAFFPLILMSWKVKMQCEPLAVPAGARYRDCEQHREARYMSPLWDFIADIVGLYIAVVFIYVILSWLIALDVIPRRNHIVYAISDVFRRLTEPALRPIRRRLPDFGGLDISPVILLLFLYFITRVVLVWLRLHLPL
jgi:YggT family protein